MKIPRSACVALVTAATTTSAFSMHGRSFVTRAAASVGSSRVSKLPLSKSISRGGHMKMFFGNIFGGGSYNLKIDYSTLDHPCPELGAAAQEGKVLVKSKKNPKLALATFAGGCFWGLELAYQRVPGVVHTAAGYAQGPEEFPNYEQVCAGNTGHTEAIMVYYNPEECKYEDLLDTFFERVDPTTANGQGADRGKQYRTGVYFHSPEQEEVARIRFETEQGNYRRPIASELKAAAPFWPAEDYHQQYLEKGGRFSSPQSAEKGATDTIRCYG